jgi:hypothetical protein
VTAPIHVIPRAIEPKIFDHAGEVDPFDPAARRGGRLLCVCRHTREKEIERLIEVFAKWIAPAVPEATLTLVGDGPDHDLFRAHAVAHGVADRTFFPGEFSVKEIPSFYRFADLFVYASLSETYGQVVSEALWCGPAGGRGPRRHGRLEPGARRRERRAGHARTGPGPERLALRQRGGGAVEEPYATGCPGDGGRGERSPARGAVPHHRAVTSLSSKRAAALRGHPGRARAQEPERVPRAVDLGRVDHRGLRIASSPGGRESPRASPATLGGAGRAVGARRRWDRRGRGPEGRWVRPRARWSAPERSQRASIRKGASAPPPRPGARRDPPVFTTRRVQSRWGARRAARTSGR